MSSTEVNRSTATAVAGLAGLEMASALYAAGEIDRAWAIVESHLCKGERSPHLAILFGQLASYISKVDEALALLLKQADIAKGLPARELALLHAVVANLLDRQGRYKEAFAHATQCNTLRGGTYDRQRVEQFASQVIAYFTRRRMACLPRSTVRSEQPVFLIGMPRSGSTLIEQILCSHPQVVGGGEVPWMFDAGYETERRTRGKAEFPYSLDRLTTSDLDALAQGYLAKVSSVAPRAVRFTDKMLSNYLNLGLITLLFPHAKVIHCLREPLDTCLSCYMIDFDTGHEFTRRLDWLGHFYSQYRRIMSNWLAVLDRPTLEVQYETMVADPRAQGQRICDFIGLQWDERCLRFYENKRLVTNSSAQQVRQPIYDRSVGRWRNYEKQLQPLRTALGWG